MVQQPDIDNDWMVDSLVKVVSNDLVGILKIAVHWVIYLVFISLILDYTNQKDHLLAKLVLGFQNLITCENIKEKNYYEGRIDKVELLVEAKKEP